jgi:hypothetical protein
MFKPFRSTVTIVAAVCGTVSSVTVWAVLTINETGPEVAGPSPNELVAEIIDPGSSYSLVDEDASFHSIR